MTKQESNKVAKQIRDDLLEQLKAQGKIGRHYEDLVDDYCKYYKFKVMMQNDISKSGLRIKGYNSSGKIVKKANESVMNLVKYTTIMLNILKELKLNEPVDVRVDDLDGYK